MNKLVGNVFRSKSDDLKVFSGLKVKKIIRELNEKDYDWELVDKTDKDESGNCRYKINCMYEIELENGEIINVYMYMRMKLIQNIMEITRNNMNCH